MKILQTFLVLIALLVLSCNTSTKPISIEAGVTKKMAEYRKANISNLKYQLKFEIPEAREKLIPGTNKISFDLQSTEQDLQIDFRENASLLHQVICNGKTSGYRFESEHLIIPKEELKKGKNEIDIEFTTGNSSLNRNDEFLYTLFVPDRARTAFPCFDQPDLKAAFQLNLTVPKHWKAMANGKLDSKKEDGEQNHYSFLTTQPLPTYLFSFVAGKFETITREHWNGSSNTKS